MKTLPILRGNHSTWIDFQVSYYSLVIQSYWTLIFPFCWLSYWECFRYLYIYWLVSLNHWQLCFDLFISIVTNSTWFRWINATKFRKENPPVSFPAVGSICFRFSAVSFLQVSWFDSIFIGPKVPFGFDVIQMDVDFGATQSYRRIDGGDQQALGHLRNEPNPLRVQDQHFRLWGSHRREPVLSQLVRRDPERNGDPSLPSTDAEQAVQLPAEPCRALFIDPQLGGGDGLVYRRSCHHQHWNCWQNERFRYPRNPGSH